MSNVEYVDFGFSEEETSRPLQDEYRDSLIETFREVFTIENSPYDEDWSYEQVDDFLDKTQNKDYIGTIAVDTQTEEVVGFTWGYRVDPQQINTDEKFPGELEDIGTELYDGETFMIDEVGVDPEYRRRGIGRNLEQSLLQKLRQDNQISRAMQRTQWSGENIPKLQLDYELGFDPFTYSDGVAEKPVLQEVPFVGNPGGDERVYLGKGLENLSGDAE